MTEKNVFLYKLFLSLNISDFSFFVKLQPPTEESYQPLFWQPSYQPTNCLSVFDHFVGLLLKSLKFKKQIKILIHASM